MVESASTADIMFWLTHPAIERMLSAKRLPGTHSCPVLHYSMLCSAALPCPALNYLVLYFLFVILSSYYSHFILLISLPFFIPFFNFFPFLHDTVTLSNDCMLTTSSAVTTMGSKEITKWPVVSGNNETWLEFSYYSFEKGTLRCCSYSNV